MLFASKLAMKFQGGERYSDLIGLSIAHGNMSQKSAVEAIQTLVPIPSYVYSARMYNDLLNRYYREAGEMFGMLAMMQNLYTDKGAKAAQIDGSRQATDL